MSLPQACELLGVSASASKEEIERAFKIKARVTHPDRSDRLDATQRMQRLNAAKETLLNEAEPTQQIPWCDLVLPTMTFSVYNELRMAAEEDEIWRSVLEKWRTYFPQCIAAWEAPQALLQTVPTKHRGRPRRPKPHRRPRPPPRSTGAATTAFQVWLPSNRQLKIPNMKAWKHWQLKSYQRPGDLYNHLVREADKYNMMRPRRQSEQQHRALLNKILVRSGKKYYLKKRQFCAQLKAIMVPSHSQ